MGMATGLLSFSTFYSRNPISTPKPYPHTPQATGAFRIYSLWCGMVGSAKSKTWKVTAKVGSGLPTAANAATTAAAAPGGGPTGTAIGAPAQHDGPAAANLSGDREACAGAASAAPTLAVLTAAPPAATPRHRPSVLHFCGGLGRPYLLEAACCLYFCAASAYALGAWGGGVGGGRGASSWALLAYCAAMAMAFAGLSLGGCMAK